MPYKLVESEVRTVRVSMMCECGGEMFPTGECFMTSPPQHGHRCQKCGFQAAIPGGVTYPAIQYRVAGPKGVDRRGNGSSSGC